MERFDTIHKPEGGIMLGKLRQAVENGEARMEAEAARGSGNNWIGTFSTLMTGIRGYFDLFTKSQEYDPREHAVLESKVSALEEEYARILARYGDKGDVPETEREALLAKLKILE